MVTLYIASNKRTDNSALVDICMYTGNQCKIDYGNTDIEEAAY